MSPLDCITETLLRTLSAIFGSLAARRVTLVQDQPERAYLIYKELIGPTVDQTNNASYGAAINLLEKMQRLTARLNKSDFDDYLIALRVEYKNANASSFRC